MSSIDCPYCRLEVHAEALVCPHCRSPLGLVAPLAKRVSELESELAKLRGRLPNTSETVASAPTTWAPAPYLDLGLGRMWCAVGLATVANLLLHALLLFVYDLPPPVLRVATLAAPALICCVAYRRRRFRTGPLLGAAGVVAVGSVLGMLGITAYLDSVPFWPQAPAEWRELLEYSIGIALGYAAGGFMARALDLASRSMQGPSLLEALLKRDDGGRRNVELVAERVNHLVTSVTPIATGALAMYSALRSLLE